MTTWNKEYQTVYGILCKYAGGDDWELGTTSHGYMLYKSIIGASQQATRMKKKLGADKIKIVSYELEDEVMFYKGR